MECRKCHWRVAFRRDDLIAAYGTGYVVLLPDLLDRLAPHGCPRLSLNSDDHGAHLFELMEDGAQWHLHASASSSPTNAFDWQTFARMTRNFANTSWTWQVSGWQWLRSTVDA
jgi:hypothetical protein